MGRSSVGDSRKDSLAAAKLKQLGLIRGASSASPKERSQKLQFKLFFPQAPYQGAEYTAARGKDGLYNFTGLVLGHHGSTIQRLQRGSGAKVEIHSNAGNLNGDHPSLDDTSLHALIQADSKSQLQRAVELLLEVMRPTNTTHKTFPVVAGGSTVLQPVPLPGWEEEEAPAPEPVAAQVQPTPNAWLDRARTRQQQQEQQQEAAAAAAKPKAQAAGQSVLKPWQASCCDACMPCGSGCAGEQSTSSTITSGSCCYGSGGEGCEQSSAPGEAPREWSLWDSASSPCLFDQLQSVVQQGLQGGDGDEGGGPTPQGGVALAFGGLEPGAGLLPFPAAIGWPLEQPGQGLGHMLTDPPQPLWGGSAHW